ncbi:MAG: YicC family protein [Pseudomonadales bacterium]|nr:YicC family protein [Pseudomonadales bacterium]
MSTMYSMTGFARAESKTSNYHLIWELKTVNHRYLETTFRLPESLRSIEQQLRDQARTTLARGKLDAVLKIDTTQPASALTVNETLLNTLLENAAVIAAKAPEAVPMTQSQLMSWPGLLCTAEGALTDMAAAAVDLFNEGLVALGTARADEGAKLHDIVKSSLNAIDAQVQQLEPIAATLPTLQRQKLQDRIDELSVKIEADRLAQEVVMLAQKADVREELDRLAIHVEQARALVDGSGPHGRRLDFLTQELNREANTLGAKAVCAETSLASIELKVLIEQIREQVQNIQ